MFLFFRHAGARTRSSSCATSTAVLKVATASASVLKYIFLLRWRCSSRAVSERILHGLHQVSKENKANERKEIMSKDIITSNTVDISGEINLKEGELRQQNGFPTKLCMIQTIISRFLIVLVQGPRAQVQAVLLQPDQAILLHDPRERP